MRDEDDISTALTVTDTVQLRDGDVCVRWGGDGTIEFFSGGHVDNFTLSSENLFSGSPAASAVLATALGMPHPLVPALRQMLFMVINDPKGESFDAEVEKSNGIMAFGNLMASDKKMPVN